MLTAYYNKMVSHFILHFTRCRVRAFASRTLCTSHYVR